MGKLTKKDILSKAFRSTQRSYYQKGSEQPFKVSRSKFNDFLVCKRCFYLDRVKGLKKPSMPGWALNTAVDELLKKELDYYRKLKKPHPIMKEYNLNFLPFEHEDMDKWREPRTGGISFIDQDTNLEIYGGVDDIWLDLEKEELVVVDYKAQSSKEKVETESYLNNKYHQGYKVQMDIYVYILKEMGFDVSSTSYFYVCNGEKTFDKFDSKINFSTTLIPYETDISWIKDKILEMKSTLDSDKIPEINEVCEHCMYLEGSKLA